MPLPLLALAGGAALSAAVPAIGRGLSTAFSPVSRAANRLQKAELEKLETGVGVGLTEAEKASGTAASIQSAQAAQAALIDEAKRTGDTASLARMANQAARAGAQTRGGLEAASGQLAQQRYENILGRAISRRTEKAQQVAAAGKAAVKGALMAGGLKAGMSGQELGSMAAGLYE